MATPGRASENIPDNSDNRLEVGSYASAAETGAASSTLVVATFNIRYAVGSFLISGSVARRLGLKMPARRPQLVARNLQRAAKLLSDGDRLPAPQILALQEADHQTTRAGGHHIARELAQALQMNYAYVAPDHHVTEKPKSKQWYLDFEERLTPSENGKTGIAILSRLPFVNIERVELPWRECAWRPRLALAATIQMGKHSIHLFNSHIDPHAAIEEQIAQHAEVLEHAERLTGATILLGDFNTLSRRSCLAMRRLLEAHGFVTPFSTGTATWRAGLIRLHTDWIFIRGAKVLRSGVARRLSVSDHWPVWVEIESNEQTDEDE